jgi:hypothetical protein
MTKFFRITTPFIAFVFAAAIGITGCGCSSSAGTDGASSSSSNLSIVDREAETAGLTELQKHWLKGPDGWTTVVVTGSAYAPDRFLRQCRAFNVDEVRSVDLSEGDKLNGLEWDGQITLKPTACREAGGQSGMVLDGMGSFGPLKQPGQWSQWVDFTPGPVRLQKTKAGWQFKWDGTYLRGTLPGPQDFAAAGVH